MLMDMPGSLRQSRRKLHIANDLILLALAVAAVVCVAYSDDWSKVSPGEHDGCEWGFFRGDPSINIYYVDITTVDEGGGFVIGMCAAPLTGAVVGIVGALFILQWHVFRREGHMYKYVCIVMAIWWAIWMIISSNAYSHIIGNDGSNQAAYWVWCSNGAQYCSIAYIVLSVLTMGDYLLVLVSACQPWKTCGPAIPSPSDASPVPGYEQPEPKNAGQVASVVVLLDTAGQAASIPSSVMSDSLPPTLPPFPRPVDTLPATAVTASDPTMQRGISQLRVLPQVELPNSVPKISGDTLVFKTVIGSGSFGKVYLATWYETPVAVKVLFDNDDLAAATAAQAISSPTMAALQKEASMMAGMRHPNIVQFLGVCDSPPSLVTEYCSAGSLYEMLKTAQTTPAVAAELTWERRKAMAMDAAQGMLYLHSLSPQIIHRDLKSPNLLVGGDWRVKVADFNLSKLLDTTGTMRNTSVAALNPRWLPPEVLQGAPAGAPGDVFAFGVVLWELLTFDLPWQWTNPWQIVSTVLAGGRLAIPATDAVPGSDGPNSPMYKGYVALLTRCWAQDPAARPTFERVVKSLRDL